MKHLITSFCFMHSLISADSIENDASCPKVSNCPSDEIINLLDIEDHWTARDKIIFIESAQNVTLHHRQACTIESAINHAGGMAALVIMTSRQLHLSNNATCHLYRSHAEQRAFFRFVDRDLLFKDTVLEDLWQGGSIQASEHAMVQTSDAMRLVLMLKYGGYYSDLDIVYFKPFRHLKNFISGDRLDYGTELDLVRTTAGPMLNNAIYHFDKGHEYIQACLNEFAAGYVQNQRLSGGPELMTRVLLKQMCISTREELLQIDKISIDPRVLPKERCKGITIIPQSAFYFYGVFQNPFLYLDKRTPSEWAELFKDSFGLHIVGSAMSNRNSKIMKPKNYGGKWPGYLYLAHNFCPVSFDSVKLF